MRHVKKDYSLLEPYARWMKSRMRKLGYTQLKFAEVMDVAVSTVNRWVNGTLEPSKKHMAKINELLKEE